MVFSAELLKYARYNGYNMQFGRSCVKLVKKNCCGNEDIYGEIILKWTKGKLFSCELY